jgi:hypothetical protein
VSARYQLQRAASGSQHTSEFSDRVECERALMRALFRDADRLIYRDRRAVLIEIEQRAALIRDRLSHQPLVSFRILSTAMIYDCDDDDSGSIDVTNLRKQIEKEMTKR